jgi:GST-like protein
MLEVYTWNTPNGYKVPILLEELGVPYNLHLVNISKDEQKRPQYLKLNPNNKIPTLVDPDAEGGPLVIFESGAIMLYLAEKYGKFMPTDVRGKYAVMEWLMFQMAGVGPMLGQLSHFVKFAPEKIDYAIERYTKEAVRLYDVLEKRLGEVEYLAGEYSIADMATWPWAKNYQNAKLEITAYPNFKRWLDAVGSRPAVIKSVEELDGKTAAAKAGICI